MRRIWRARSSARTDGSQNDGGSILNIGSVTAHLPLSRVFAYSASKAAVVNLTQNVAREYATRGVRVNALCPGFFPAEQNRKILDEQRVEKYHGAKRRWPASASRTSWSAPRCCCSRAERRQLHHRRRVLRRRRLHGDAVLKGSEFSVRTRQLQTLPIRSVIRFAIASLVH